MLALGWLSRAFFCPKRRKARKIRGSWVISSHIAERDLSNTELKSEMPQNDSSRPQLQYSEAWGPPQFQEKRSRSERAILGALGEFRGILGAALGIGNSILGIRNSILGMASHDLINTKPTILGATLGAIPGIAANPPERFSFAPAFSERFFKNWGGPRAPEILDQFCTHGCTVFIHYWAGAWHPHRQSTCPPNTSTG